MTSYKPVLYVLMLLVGMLTAHYLPVKNASAEERCFYDGELGVVAPMIMGGLRWDRNPLGSAERAAIVEISWPGAGFAGLNHAILIVPQKGKVWQLHLRDVTTYAERLFCGTPAEVSAWAIKSHLPSFSQATRNPKGVGMPEFEAPVIVLNFEEGTLTVVSEGLEGVAEGLLDRLDASFNEGSVQSAQPLHLAWTE